MFTYRIIFGIISFLTVALIYGSFSAVDVFGTSTSSCVPDPLDNNVQYCCYQDSSGLYCATCFKTSDGWNCGSFDKMDKQMPTPNPTPPKGDQGLFGSNGLPPPVSPGDSGSVEQPPITPGAPVAPPTVSPPEDNQEDGDGTGDGGGGKPPGGNNLVPETGIGDQPEVQQPEEPSNEGQDTAGPLT